MQPHKEYTYWLLPAEPLRSKLTTVVGNLAREFDAVAFDPHVTVFCSRSNDAEAQRVTQQIAQSFKPFALHATGFEQSSLLTKTFYVQFQPSSELQRMFDLLRDSVAAEANHDLNPHLSLLYQRIAEPQRQELCHRTSMVPMGTYWFDRLRVVEIDLPIEDLRPIRTWRTVAEYSLRHG
jgi:2'-5' RNA ligase